MNNKDEISVGLKLDTSGFKKGIKDASKSFETFQNNLELNKLTDELKYYNKLLDDTKNQLKKVSKILPSETIIKRDILPDFEGASGSKDTGQIKITRSTPDEIPLPGKEEEYNKLNQEAEEYYQRIEDLKSKIEDIKKEYNDINGLGESVKQVTNQWVDGVMITDSGLRLYKKDQKEINEDTENNINDLSKIEQVLENIRQKIISITPAPMLKFFDYMMGTEEEINDELEEQENNQNNITEAEKESGEQLERNRKTGNAISRLVDRIGMSMRRQIVTSIASALNPLNMFRKTFSYMTEILSPRLGATFKNIGNNIYEYFANSSIFQNFINGLLKAIYYAQGLYNILARIFGWKQIDLFKRSVKSAKAIEKSASRTAASFDEINDIGSQGGGGGDATPMGAGELFTEDELSKMDQNLALIEEKIKGIKENWLKWVLIIGAAVVGFLLLKSVISGIFSSKGDLTVGINNFLTSFGKAAESIAILGGLALVINAIANLIEVMGENGTTWEQLGQVGLVLGEVALGFTAFLGVMKLFGEIDWSTIAAAAVILGGLALVLNQITGLLNVLNQRGQDSGSVFGELMGVFGAIIILMGALAAVAYILGSNPLYLIAMVVVVAALSALLLVLKETLPDILDACATFINAVIPSIIDLLNTIKDVFATIIKQLGVTLPPIINSIGNLFTRIFEGVVNVINAVGNVIVKILQTVDKTVSNVFNSILNFINKLGPAINNCVDGIIQAVTKVINFFVSGIEYLINTIIIKPINSLIKKVTNGAIGELLDWVGIPKLKTIGTISIDRFVPRLDIGTNYVPNDQLAMIHKGEAIIPKKFNDREFFGSGNEETNNLLEELIERVENIELNPYIQVRDIGEASINYINNKSRITGRSVI